jgi:NAD(P)-dependent dehydrogenase (short-subunit alcohol dehydrogenase family)
MKKLPFQDQIAIVTGASRGIGRATALELARGGADLCLASRDVLALEETARLVHAQGREALVVETDVSCQPQVESMVNRAIDRWGRVDILVSNGGIYVRSPILHLDVATLEHSMATNFYGHVHCVLAVLPHMLERRHGHIVLVSSYDGKKALPGDSPYAAAKFALNGFGEALRQELSPKGIFTTLIIPGRVDTDFIYDLKVPRIQPPIPPGQVARAIARGIQKRKAEVILPGQVLLLHYTNALHPRLGDLVVRIFHLQGWEVDPGD